MNLKKIPLLHSQSMDQEFYYKNLQHNQNLRLFLNKNKEKDNKKNLGGSPRKLYERDERIILRFIESRASETAAEISKYLSEFHKMNISASTIRRLLSKAGMRSAKKVNKPFLNSKHRKERYEFSKRYRNWSIDDWKQVV